MTKTWTMLAAVTVTLSAQAAWACSCTSAFTTFPRDGATNVPTNVVIRVVLHSQAAPGYRLVRAVDQQQVPLEVRDGPGSRLRSLTPATKLDANAAYTLEESATARTIGFTTSAHEDHDVPSRPELKSASYQVADYGCGERRLWTLRVEGGDDVTTARDQLLLLVHGEASTEPTQAIGVTWFDSLELDTGVCSANFDPPGGDGFTLGVQVLDLAGNVSEVSTGRPIRASGCAAAPAGALAALGLLLLRRRSGLKNRPTACHTKIA